jgi:hypothetical protein
MKHFLIGRLALAASLFVTANASAATATGFSSGGYTYPVYNPTGVALLDSFYFRYEDGDHHLASLSARLETPGTITLALADDNNDDDYYYTVEHKERSTAGIISGSFVDFCNGSCLYPLSSPGAGYVFALRGFRFYYRNGDHHMNQVGILREANGVRTYFNDQNSDDPYVVYVDYAWLPSSMVARTGTAAGTDDGGGVQTAVANADRAVISGFLMDYLNGGDHHIQELGVLTRTTDVQVYYGDDNQDDDFSYQVDYAVLAASRLVGPMLELPFEQLSPSGISPSGISPSGISPSGASSQELPALPGEGLSLDEE